MGLNVLDRFTDRFLSLSMIRQAGVSIFLIGSVLIGYKLAGFIVEPDYRPLINDLSAVNAGHGL